MSVNGAPLPLIEFEYDGKTSETVLLGRTKTYGVSSDARRLAAGW